MPIYRGRAGRLRHDATGVPHDKTGGSGGGGAYTDEQAQDAVGGMATDTATIDLTYNDGAAALTADLKDTAVVAGTYGDGSNYPIFTVDAQGRITSASETPTGGGGFSSRTPKIPTDIGGNQWQFSGTPYEVYVNGQKLRSIGASPDYTLAGDTITLAWTLLATDHIEGFVAGTPRVPEIPSDLGSNQWQFSGPPYEVYVNGQKLRFIGTSPDYTVVGDTITLAWTLLATDHIEGYVA